MGLRRGWTYISSACVPPANATRTAPALLASRPFLLPAVGKPMALDLVVPWAAEGWVAQGWAAKA
jgi:hypothetical protein